MTGPRATATPPSAARQILASPLYRGATIAMFLSGLATAQAKQPQAATGAVRSGADQVAGERGREAGQVVEAGNGQ